MKTLILEHIGPDMGTVSKYMKLEKKYYIHEVVFLHSDVYTLTFEFIPENEKDKKDYWLKIWRLRSHIDFINYCFTNILNGEILTN